MIKNNFSADVGKGKIMKKLLCVMMVLCVLLCGGCAGAESEARAELENMLNAFKSCDKAQINKYYSYDSLTAYLEAEEGEILSDAVFQTLAHMNYEIKGSEKVNGTAIKFNVDITTVDFSAIMEAYINKVTALVATPEYQQRIKLMQEEDYSAMMADLMIEAIEENSSKTTTKNTDITMIKGESGWTLGGRSDDLLGMLFENLSNAVENLV